MKFTCSTKDIASAVGAASKMVNAHTTVPILSNVLLSTDGDGIRVRATDLELTLEQHFPADITEPGSLTGSRRACSAVTWGICRPARCRVSRIANAPVPA